MKTFCNENTFQNQNRFENVTAVYELLKHENELNNIALFGL